MAWLIVCNSSGVAQGRVRLGALTAVAKIDDLILNGS